MRRIPVNLNPQQMKLIAFILVIVVLALLLGLLLEVVVGRSLSLALRAGGVKPPKKTFYRMRLEQLDRELGDPDADRKT